MPTASESGKSAGAESKTSHRSKEIPVTRGIRRFSSSHRSKETKTSESNSHIDTQINRFLSFPFLSFPLFWSFLFSFSGHFSSIFPTHTLTNIITRALTHLFTCLLPKRLRTTTHHNHTYAHTHTHTHTHKMLIHPRTFGGGSVRCRATRVHSR